MGAACNRRAAGCRAAAPLLVVGDSLSAEYGLERGSGWVALLQQRLAREKIAVEVVNASISGDTTSGGRSRLPALLAQHKPAHRDHRARRQRRAARPAAGHDAANLAAMAQAAKAAGARVLIVGMQVPPNYGQKYAQDFADLFAGVAKAEGAALVPFLLAGVADGPDADSAVPGRPHPPAARRRSRACWTTSGRC